VGPGVPGHLAGDAGHEATGPGHALVAQDHEVAALILGHLHDALGGVAGDGAAQGPDREEPGGVLVFLAAITLLMLVVLPFTRRDREAAIDRPATFVLLAAIGITAYGLRVLEIASMDALALPNRAPGLWLTGAGLAIIAWGVAEVFNERAPEW
jgi:hypothetical protein